MRSKKIRMRALRDKRGKRINARLQAKMQIQQPPMKLGTACLRLGPAIKNGIFCCPSDTAFDIKEGHNQSSVLDKLTESIRRLRKMQHEITRDADWLQVDGNQVIDPQQTPVASSGARVKRPALGPKEGPQSDKDK